MKDEDNRKDSDKLSVNRCIALGILLCTGEKLLKARLLYDMLQHEMQPQIAARDPDFQIVFRIFIEMACYLIPDMFK